MEAKISITMRIAFITDGIIQRVFGIPPDDSTSPNFATLFQKDPLKAIIQSYCQCMGAASFDKTNLFALQRLLAECGVQMIVAADVIRTIGPEDSQNRSITDIENDLRAYAETCSDPYRRTSEGSSRLGPPLLRAAFSANVKEMIRQHSATLSRKRGQLVIYDDYGSPDLSKWHEEMKYFATKVLFPLGKSDPNDSLLKEIFEYIEEIVSQIQSVSQGQRLSERTPDLSPRDFELHCSEALQRQGWNARLTKSTGDQGIDIVAQRNGLTLVLQCKQYSAPVGNKAIQEAHAGKDFLKADLAVVVSNAPFTRSAKELAASLNVLILHHTQLDEFDRVLFLNAQRRQQ